MQIKMLIVDDESPIKEWICMCIQSLYQESVLLTASNGEEAWDCFQAERPDMVITDICMPVLDGLELLKRIHTQAPEVPVVILSCFGEFAYSQQAMRYGAAEYLLKTEISEQILGELIERNLCVSADTQSAQWQDNERSILKRNILIKQLLLQDGTQSCEALFRENGVIWPLKSYIVLAISSDMDESFVLQNRMLECGRRTLYLPYKDGLFLFAVEIESCNSKAAMLSDISGSVKRLSHNVCCACGVSAIYKGLDQLPRAVRQALFQLSIRFYGEDISIEQQLESRYDARVLEIDFKTFYAQVNKCCAVIADEPDAAKAAISDFCDYVLKMRIPDVTLVKGTLRTIVENYLRSCTDWAARTDSSSLAFFHANSFHEIRDTLGKVLNDQKTENRFCSEHVQRAIDYTNQHFTEIRNMSEVAEVVGLSPAYFSKLFKDETGMTFTNYLTKLRMQEAARLIQKTSMRINEIAERMGYANLAYFSTVFRKYYEINPFEYRKNAKQGKRRG